MNEDLQKKEENTLDYGFYSELSQHYDEPETNLTEKQGKCIAYGMLVLFIIFVILIFAFDGAHLG